MQEQAIPPLCSSGQPGIAAAVATARHHLRHNRRDEAAGDIMLKSQLPLPLAVMRL
jgi:hypothetical protein